MVVAFVEGNKDIMVGGRLPLNLCFYHMCVDLMGIKTGPLGRLWKESLINRRAI